jgi:hypothetical protein
LLAVGIPVQAAHSFAEEYAQFSAAYKAKRPADLVAMLDTSFRIKLYSGPTLNRDQLKGLLNRNFARTHKMLEAVVKPVSVKETGNAAAVETASWFVMQVKDARGILRTIRIRGRQRHIWRLRADTWLLAEAVETDEAVTVDGRPVPTKPLPKAPAPAAAGGARAKP